MSLFDEYVAAALNSRLSSPDALGTGAAFPCQFAPLVQLPPLVPVQMDNDCACAPGKRQESIAAHATPDATSIDRRLTDSARVRWNVFPFSDIFFASPEM